MMDIAAWLSEARTRTDLVFATIVTSIERIGA